MVAIPSAISIPLLFQDASDIVLGALLQPTWGVYLNGQPVLTPASSFNSPSSLSGTLASIAQVAGLIGNLSSFVTGGGLSSFLQGGTFSLVLPAVASTVEFEYSQELPLSNYPQEQGAFTTYNKVTLPFDVRLRVCAGGTLSQRQSFLSTCLAIKDSFQLFSVVTPEMVFSSVNCTHIAWRRTAHRNNTLIEVDLGFVQVPVVQATGFTNTVAPGESSQQGLGAVQPFTPSTTTGNVTSTPITPFAAGNLT